MSRLLLAAPWAILLAASLYPVLQSKPFGTQSPEAVAMSNEPLVRSGLPTEDENADRRSRRDEFVALQKDWLAELHAQRITVSIYVDRVMTHCLVSYPEQLENVEMIEEGRSLREKVVRNVLRVCEKSEGGGSSLNFEAMRVVLEGAVREIAGQK